MEDTINTGTWHQPNTFMDVMSPRKGSSPRAMPAKSATLMRTAVKKPEPETISQDIQPMPAAATSRPRQLNLEEASKLTGTSPLVSRFSSNAAYQQADTANEQPAQPMPMSIESPANDNIEAMTNSSMDTAPLDSPIEEQGYQPSTSMPMEAQASELAIEQPALNIFNNAPSLESMDLGQQTKKRRRIGLGSIKKMSGWTVLAVVLVGLIGGGIYVSRNLGTLELYLASSRAGFSATLPGSKPSGFALTGISTASGVIEAAFKSSTGGRSYTISEKKSSLTSGQLLAGYVTNQAGLNYQMVSSGNMVIYIYSGHDATWVNKGIWYVVQDNNSLSDHQIINIASTM